MTEQASPNDEAGTPGYPVDTPGYPVPETEAAVPAPSDAGGDRFHLKRFLEPREAAKLVLSDQPIAHEGKAGWAVERATGRAVWLSGERQYDVMARSPGAVRDEPGLSDVPAHGGLPSPAPADTELERDTSGSRRKRVQIGLKLSFEQADELEEAAELFGVSRTTLARLLVVRGAREIVDRAKG